jgi:exodeoxyribonuclease VII large subunit
MKEKISLTELQLLIRDSLYLSLPGFYWVVAEISEIKENYAGHCYLELIEKDPDEINIRARIRAVIWSSRYGFIKSFFENFTGETLHSGIKILMKVRIEYHEIYGLSLVITDVDPSYTVGELAVKRQQILKRLEEEGVISMNKELDFPFVPQRIAVISSKNAAGYTDFIKHLANNPYGFRFLTRLFETPLQGTETEQGVIRALDRIAENGPTYDVVAIIRGGGSQTDLSWFDNYNIAFHITQFPLPVITGIGHDKDMSVTDIVACKSLKTPTAVADFLIEKMMNADEHIAELSTGIVEISRQIIERNRQRLENCRIQLIPLARILISELKEQLSGVIIDVINTGKGFVLKAGMLPLSQKTRMATAARSLLASNVSIIAARKDSLVTKSGLLTENIKKKIETVESTLKILDPQNVLKRGYTITSLNGRILKSSKEVKTDDLINTRFIDGSVESRIEGPEYPKNQ